MFKIKKIKFNQFFWKGVSNFSEIMGLISTICDDIDYIFLKQLSQIFKKKCNFFKNNFNFEKIGSYI